MFSLSTQLKRFHFPLQFLLELLFFFFKHFEFSEFFLVLISNNFIQDKFYMVPALYMHGVLQNGLGAPFLNEFTLKHYVWAGKHFFLRFIIKSETRH